MKCDFCDNVIANLNRAVTLTAQIAGSDPEVERAEALGGEDPRAVFEVGEDVLEALVDLRPEGEVVDEDDGGLEDVLAVVGVEEVAGDELEGAEGLAVEAHPEAEPLLHVL